MDENTIETIRQPASVLISVATVLARAGHHVHAGLRLSRPEGEERASVILDLAGREGLDLCVVDMDVLSEPSCRAAVDQVVGERGGSTWWSTTPAC